jgi:hypothetical protein
MPLMTVSTAVITVLHSTEDVHQAKRAEVGLTEEVGRRWGGGKWPTRWRSGGRAAPAGWRCPQGGPVARGEGEGGRLRAQRRSGMKSTTWGKNLAGGRRQRPFKGGPAESNGEGAGESGDAWSGAGAREGAPGMAENGSSGRHRPPGGGTHAARTSATDRRDRTTAGPSGKRRGAGRARLHNAALTCGPVA